MSFNKRQAYQAAARAKVKEGLINRADDGQWVKPPDKHGSMFRSQAFGYKLGLALGLPVSKRK